MKQETDLKVIVKSKELAEHTFRVTSNCNTYPKKYRFSLVDKMQVKSLEIYEKLIEANRTRLEDKYRRAELQTAAITRCEELQFFIELSMRLEIINAQRAEYWSGLVSDVKYMAIAWRSGDKDR